MPLPRIRTQLARHVERVDLGGGHGHSLSARVERRSLAITLGPRPSARLVLSRAQPLAIEVASPGGARVLPLAVPADPFLRALRYAALALALAVLLPRIVARLRRSE